MSVTRRLSWITGLAVGTGCLVLFAWGVDWRQVGQSFRLADYVYVFPATLIILASLAMRAVRWQVLLAPIIRLPLRPLLSATMIGFAANAALPGKVGELVRPAALKFKTRVSMSASLGTVVIERMLDSVAMVVFFAVLLILLPAVVAQEGTTDAVGPLRTMAIVVVLGLGGATFVLISLKRWPGPTVRALRRVLGVFPEGVEDRAGNMVKSFLQGVTVLNSVRQFCSVTLLSLVIWGLRVAAIYVLALCFSGMNIGVTGALLVFVGTAFAVTLPQLPGYAGVFHAAVRGALLVIGIQSGAAESYAILLWGVSILPPMAIGVIYFWLEGFRLADLRGTSVARRDAPTA